MPDKTSPEGVKMLKEQVAELIRRACEKYDTANNQKLLVKVHAEEILNLFKAEIDKLGDRSFVSNVEEHLRICIEDKDIEYHAGRIMVKLQHTKNQLDLMGE